jgi:hypothetical protein
LSSTVFAYFLFQKPKVDRTRANNMLSLEVQLLKMKRTDAVDLVKPLKGFLAKQYGENVSREYDTSLSNLQQKRSQLLNLQERSEGSRDLCLKYAAELDYIAKHFPINSGAPRVSN